MARRPVLSVFIVALAVRVITATVITVMWGGTLFLDDVGYSRLAELAANGAIDDPYDDFLYERTATLLVPIVGMYWLFGPIELFGQLYVALLGAATAALTARLALEIVDRRWALLAGLIVAALPSQVLWSSLILKDAAVWAVLSALALVVAVAARSGGRRLALMGATAAVLLVLLGFLRLHTLQVACVAILLAVLVYPRPRPLVRLSGAIVLLACIPLVFGMGLAGGSFVADSRDPGAQRALNAAEAESAVVPAPAEAPAPADAPVPTPAGPAGPTPAGPPVPAPADPSALPQEDGQKGASGPGTSPDEPSGALRSVRYLPTGMTVVALRPWPWESSSTSLGMRFARAEALIWYPLLLLALVGIAAIGRHRRTLAFPVIAGGAILVMYGLTEGNLGTAYRHRGEFVWVVALLAALGAERIAAWRRERRGPVDRGDQGYPRGLARIPA
jgi:hypothetical protein